MDTQSLVDQYVTNFNIQITEWEKQSLVQLLNNNPNAKQDFVNSINKLSAARVKLDNRQIVCGVTFIFFAPLYPGAIIGILLSGGFFTLQEFYTRFSENSQIMQMIQQAVENDRG